MFSNYKIIQLIIDFIIIVQERHIINWQVLKCYIQGN